MIKKYCSGIPLYLAALAATLFFHGLALHWDNEADASAKPIVPARHT